MPAIAQQTNTVQPTIMVIPFTKEGEDIRQVIEADVNKRVVLTSIKEAFDNHGFTTIDFLGKFKAMSTQTAFNQKNQTDLVSDIIANAGSDIYISAEIDINSTSQGTSVKIIMTAFDSSTGQSLANKMGDSGRFYTNDIAKLADVAIKKNMEAFLINMQDKFNDMVANGRSIIVNIGINEDSEYLMSSEIGSDGDLLSEVIESWMEENAYKNYYHLQGTTEKSMIFDDVKIPLRYVNDKGKERNYNINRFSTSIRKFFRGLGLNVGQPQINGNQLYISVK